jgi:hypothetical protein
MEIGQQQKGIKKATTSGLTILLIIWWKISYDHTDFLKKLMAFAFMTYIIDLNVHELHPGDEEVFNNFTMNAKIFHFTYDMGWFFFKSVI